MQGHARDLIQSLVLAALGAGCPAPEVSSLCPIPESATLAQRQLAACQCSGRVAQATFGTYQHRKLGLLIVIDNSTIKPASARMIAEKLKEKGVFSLDAPVSGGDIGARNATLTIMVGGDADALEKALPVLQAMGRTITLVGDAGAGQVAKAANLIMVAAQMVAMGELLVFSKKAGVDPRKVVDAIKAGAAQCWALDIKPPRLFDGNRNPGFKSYMQLKDMNIVLETAKEYDVPVSATEENTKLYQQMIEMGMGELDNSAVVGVIEKLAGIGILD